jgi:hypothetical protein
MGENLMDGLMDELNRNRELLKEYQKIPTGMFGAAFIKNDIEMGEKAIREGDTVEMVKAYARLKENK